MHLSREKEKGDKPIAQDKEGQIYVKYSKGSTKEIPLENGEYIPHLIDDKQRCSFYISGASGSGKSTEASRIVKELKKMPKYKDNAVIFVSLTEEDDPAFENMDYFRMPLNDEYLEAEPTYFKNCIVIFDDIESGDKQLVRQIIRLNKKLLERGRKNNIVVISILHQTLNYQTSRDMIFESDVYVLYPSFNLNSTLRFLKHYLDVDNRELRQIQSLIKDERKIWIRKSVPRVLVTSEIVKLL